MVKGILFFVLMWVAVCVGISIFRSLKNAEKWSLLKLLTYSGFTAAVSLLIVVVLVSIF